MRIIRKPIDVVAIFKKGELPIPAKVRMGIEGQEIVTKVDKIIKVSQTKTVGHGEIVFVCQSIVLGRTRVYEIKYIIDTFQWVLYKL